MSVPDSTGSGSPPDLFASLRNFWGVIVAILYTRLDLATLELEEEATRAVNLVVISLAALMCGAMAIFFLLFFLVVTFWEERVWVIGGVFVVCSTGTTALVFIARKMVQERPKFLSQTLAELRKDVESLRPKPAPKAAEAPQTPQP